MSDWNKPIIEEFYANAGKVGGRFEGKPLLLLHSTGAKSGKTHLTPAVYTKDGERFVVTASFAGAHHHPDWYHNLVANPLASVEIGTEKFLVRAEVVPEPDRTRLYKQFIATMDAFAEYEKITTRVIPVIALTRVK